MECFLNFTSEEDVISAVELIYEKESVELLTSDIYGINSALSFTNFGCIKDTDKVIVIGAHLEIPALLISHIYSPQDLVLIDTKELSTMNRKVWTGIEELLPASKYTEPTYSGFEKDYEHETFDVAVMGFTAEINRTEAPLLNRFSFETGMECEFFEGGLKKFGSMLKGEGRLIALCKPAWILRNWELIENLHLQLEYESYYLYIGKSRHPNSLVWLRFVKKVEGFKKGLQKKNLLSLMKDNDIDRLYAHRNSLRFPYVEMCYNNSEAFVKLNQKLEYLQYFFSAETTANLAKLCEGYTACLVTPSVAQYAYKLNKNIVLFERDNRFRENGGLKYVKYDLNIGLTKLLQNKYSKKFDRVICDPPFDIKLEVLAKDIIELLKQSKESIVYIVFPSSRKISLVNAMKTKGLLLEEEREKMIIEYAKPPKIVRVNGRNAIQLYKFTYVESSA